MFEPAPDRGVYNTLLATGPLVVFYVAYRKIHLFDAFGARESDLVAPGRERVVIEVGGVRVGLATCFDLRFADQFTALGRDGAELVVVPASWGAGPGKEEQWDLLTRARATDAQAWLLACDQAWAPPTGSDPLESAAACWSTRSARCAPDSGSPRDFCARKWMSRSSEQSASAYPCCKPSQALSGPVCANAGIFPPTAQGPQPGGHRAGDRVGLAESPLHSGRDGDGVGLGELHPPGWPRTVQERRSCRVRVRSSAWSLRGPRRVRLRLGGRSDGSIWSRLARVSMSTMSITPDASVNECIHCVHDNKPEPTHRP